MFRPQRPGRFLIISSNSTLWGGSEELWASTGVALAEAGHHVSVLKLNVDRAQPAIQKLQALGARIYDHADVAPVPAWLYGLIARVCTPLVAIHRRMKTSRVLKTMRPDLVVISQGGNFDGVPTAELCRRIKQPFVLIAQKAGEIYWPDDYYVEPARAVYTEALATYFVSEHNRRLTEEQLGLSLGNASVVRNPFLVDWNGRDDWPAQDDGLRLACIGRLFPSEKGQDLLLRVLAREHWRTRPLSVTFYGSGIASKSLERMAEFYELQSVTFAGFTNDVDAVWAHHHGLILPSRCEGLPLVLVEAMLSGRVPIVTDVAGNSEIVRDNVTGFLASVPTADALDEALERAWQRRHEWRSIGTTAAATIRTLIPPAPAETLAAKLIALLRPNAICEEPAVATMRSTRSSSAPTS